MDILQNAPVLVLFHTIVTGISDAVAETIVDLGIDWSKVDTLRDLQSGLLTAFNRLGYRMTRTQS